MAKAQRLLYEFEDLERAKNELDSFLTQQEEMEEEGRILKKAENADLLRDEYAAYEKGKKEYRDIESRYLRAEQQLADREQRIGELEENISNIRKIIRDKYEEIKAEKTYEKEDIRLEIEEYSNICDNLSQGTENGASFGLSADLETRNNNPVDGRKIKGTIHWVSEEYSMDAEIRLYDNLFTKENLNELEEGDSYLNYLNPESLKVLKGCKMELSLKDAEPSERFQFVRTGYFCKDTRSENVFNRIVSLKDSFKPQQ